MTSPSEPRPAWYEAILPVIDLQQGQVVRAVGGNRPAYRAIESRSCSDARVESVAAALVGRFGFRDCYVADLDAIEGGSLDVASLEAIGNAGLSMWLDAGSGSLTRWRLLREQGAHLPIERHVVGLESLVDWDELARLVEAIGAERLVLSLDLKHGAVLSKRLAFQGQTPQEVALAAARLGVKSLLLLDLAAVGTGQGTATEPLLKALHQALPQVSLASGGGIGRVEEIARQLQLGAQRVLVASALHDGRIPPFLSGSK